MRRRKESVTAPAGCWVHERVVRLRAAAEWNRDRLAEAGMKPVVERSPYDVWADRLEERCECD